MSLLTVVFIDMFNSNYGETSYKGVGIVDIIITNIIVIGAIMLFIITTIREATINTTNTPYCSQRVAP